MPRRATQLASSTTTTPKTPSALVRTPSSRQSSRLKSSPIPTTAITPKASSTKPTNGSAPNTTPKKSQYFSAGSASSEASSPPSAGSSFDNEESGYEDEDPSASAISSPPAASSESSPDPSSEDERPKKRKRGARKETANKKVAVKMNGEGAVVGKKGQELWRPGVKSKLAPGEAVFVALPKARGNGGVGYVDGRVHPNTMVFLGELKENNDREWLKGESPRRSLTLRDDQEGDREARNTGISVSSRKMLTYSTVHDADYRQSKKDFDSFVESLTPLIAEKDETIPELPPKDLVSPPSP
jgi:hypothetical protein